MDLSAFIGDKPLYSDLINDFAACDVVYSYWQFPDTNAAFTIETEECTTYANVGHSESIDLENSLGYAEHMKDEPDSFSITKSTGAKSLILLSVLLRDRYFPKAWTEILSQD